MLWSKIDWTKPLTEITGKLNSITIRLMIENNEQYHKNWIKNNISFINVYEAAITKWAQEKLFCFCFLLFFGTSPISDEDAVQVHSEKSFKEETFYIVHISQLTLQQYLRPFVFRINLSLFWLAFQIIVHNNNDKNLCATKMLYC